MKRAENLVGARASRPALDYPIQEMSVLALGALNLIEPSGSRQRRGVRRLGAAFRLADSSAGQNGAILRGEACILAPAMATSRLKKAGTSPRTPNPRGPGGRPARFLLAAVLLGCLWFGAGSAPAEVAKPQIVRSRSGQFVVRGLPFRAPAPAPVRAGPPAEYLHLDPTVVAVSCERIKHALLRELDLSDRWEDTIYLVLQPVREDDEAIWVASLRHTDGWSYQLNVPDQVDTQRFIRALTRVLVLEMANRQSGPQQAEPPLWLIEGLSAHLAAQDAASLALEPETRINKTERDPDLLRAVKTRLQGRLPLTLEQLSWPPTEEQVSAQTAGIFQSSSHLFVYDLLRLKKGRACLARMIYLLSEHLNWQLAFVRSFQPHFARLIDADKWWALRLVQFTQQDLGGAWSPAQAWQQLDEILVTPVQVRVESNELPLAAEVKLQNVLSEWPFDRQSPLVRQKLDLLQALRLRAPKEVSQLADGYAETLAIYLQKRGPATDVTQLRSQSLGQARLSLQEALKRLDELDQQRAFARRKSELSVATAEPPSKRGSSREAPPGPTPRPSRPRVRPE